MALVERFDQLRVYQLSFDAAMRIFQLTKEWPADERYSLTSQIRRSSRSVCGSIAEAWRKRRYSAHFTRKLTDADGEAAETQNWLKFAQACGYITPDESNSLWQTHDRVTGGLVTMMSEPDRWCGPSLLRESVAEYVVDSPPS